MNKCLLCGRPLNISLDLSFLLSFKPYRPPIICQRCNDQFELIEKGACCRECSRPGSFGRNLCADCQYWRKISEDSFKNYSLYQYNSMMSEYMRRYKFKGDYRLRKVFQGKLSRFVNRFDRTVVPIPVHRNTYQRRGFNQVMGLLRNVRIVKALTTLGDHKSVPQSRKTRADRLRLPQPFKITDEYQKLIDGRKVVVVDDVYTTGTTVHHAARLLKRAGAKSVISVTLAR